MNGWLHDSKSRLTKDSVRRALEGRRSGRYRLNIEAVKTEDGDVKVNGLKIEQIYVDELEQSQSLSDKKSKEKV